MVSGVEQPWEERLMLGFVRNNENGCWEWFKGKDSSGYGAISVGRAKFKTHRLSWNIHNGAIPNGMQVLHKCDNRKCLNPAHLFLGTNADNVADKMAKNRNTVGSRNGMSKLREKDIESIFKMRKEGLTHAHIGKYFGVSQVTINNVLNKISWKHKSSEVQYA